MATKSETDDSGRYIFNNLDPATYEIKAEAGASSRVINRMWFSG